MQDKAPSRYRHAFEVVVNVSRRASAVVFTVWWIVAAATGHPWLYRETIALLEPYLSVSFPASNALLAAGALWYAFLTQLSLWWFVTLPVYLVVYPWWAILLFVSRPALRWMKSLFGDEPITPTSVPFPTKRIWLVLFFVYVIAFSGLQMAWAAWIPPLLAIPVWLYFLRLAYASAVAPNTFATLTLTMCGGLLDSHMKSREKEGAKPGAGKQQFPFKFVDWVISRYAQDRIRTVIQREAIAVFSLALLSALFASASFWALTARALMRSTSSFASAYHFFHDGSFLEALAWAWGCMTTSVSMPGELAPTWLKLMHSAVLLTGLFQITYLIACFSIMAGSEAERIAREATSLLAATEEKARISRTLEVIDVATMPGGTKP